MNETQSLLGNEILPFSWSKKINEKQSLGNENLPYDVPSMYLDDPIVKLLLNAGAKAHMKNSTVPFIT